MQDSSRNIAIFGTGWAHNIGNAFIQLGSEYAVRAADPTANVHIIDSVVLQPPSSAGNRILAQLGTWLKLPALKSPVIQRGKKAKENQITLLELAKLDAIVLSGVWLTAGYLRLYKKALIACREQGTSIIFNGAGGTFYTPEEYREVAEILKEIRPKGIITRDHIAYEAYKDSLPNVLPGIDVGFFVNNACQDKLFPLRNAPRVYCFDRSTVPAHLPIDENTILAQHCANALRFNTLTKGRTFFSEVPEDYIRLYAGCSTLHSDRVHACVAALAFGNHAQLISETPRAHLFGNVGIEAIQEKLVQADTVLLQNKKDAHLKALKSIL